MTIDSAKDLQMNIAKEGLALLMFHPSFNVQPHRVHLPHWHSVGHPRGVTRRRSSRFWIVSWM